MNEAFTISHDLGERGGEAQILNEMGTLHLLRGYVDQAGACHRQALVLALRIHSAWDEGHAVAGRARCALAKGRTAAAVTDLRQSWEIFQPIGAAEASEVAAELNTLLTPPDGATAPN
jgi:hypothetical protein